MDIIRTTGTGITARITATIVPTTIAATTPIIAPIAITATTVGTDITGSSVPGWAGEEFAASQVGETKHPAQVIARKLGRSLDSVYEASHEGLSLRLVPIDYSR